MKKTDIKQLRTWVEVSKSAINSNLRTVKSIVGEKVKVFAVLKSNAYGHGMLNVAEIVTKTGVFGFAVDSIEEALALRKAGHKKYILVMGFMPTPMIKEAVQKNIAFVAYNLDVCKELKKLSDTLLKKNTALVHLKIETGTVRQGLTGQELVQYAQKLSKIKGVKIDGLYTHYANIEDTTDHEFAMLQLSSFGNSVSAITDCGIKPNLFHTACSAAILLFPQTHKNAVRLGVSLYGLWSSKETRAIAQREHKGLKLHPALTWKTRIAQVKTVAKGTAIGYGLTERVTRASRIAVVPVGYWDGLDRGLSSIGHFLVHGVRCKIMGRICMNMCMIDVTDLPSVHPGDEVVILGQQGLERVTAEEIAGQLNTINYEIVTRINPLLTRITVA